MSNKLIYKMHEYIILDSSNQIIYNTFKSIDFNKLPSNVFNNIPLYLGNNYGYYEFDYQFIKNLLIGNEVRYDTNNDKYVDINNKFLYRHTKVINKLDISRTNIEILLKNRYNFNWDATRIMCCYIIRNHYDGWWIDVYST